MDGRYWIAINGSSCALASLPFTNPKVTPIPRQLIGFSTYNEAREAQRICLNDPTSKVIQFMENLQSRVKAGQVMIIQPSHPQPSTKGPTLWTDDDEIHAINQSLFQPDDVN